MLFWLRALDKQPENIYLTAKWIGVSRSASGLGAIRGLSLFMDITGIALAPRRPAPDTNFLSIISKARFDWPGLRTRNPIGRAVRSANCMPIALALLSTNRISKFESFIRIVL